MHIIKLKPQKILQKTLFCSKNRNNIKTTLKEKMGRDFLGEKIAKYTVHILATEKTGYDFKLPLLYC